MIEDSHHSILIIEDDTSTLASLKRLLEKKFNIIACENAEEAIKKVDHHPEIAVVVCDYLLPHMSGLDFLTLVQIRNPSIVRIIITGALNTSELTHAVQKQVIHRVFKKPLDNDLLTLQLTEALIQHKTLNERAVFEKLSFTDSLTQLHNQRYFHHYLTMEIERAQRHQRILSLLMIDVDGFKEYNDSKGHPAGNTLLKDLAAVYLENIRSIDLAFRYAGDEFAIILPDTSSTKAKDIAERIRKRVEEKGNNITLSLGIAAFPQHATQVDTLIKKADQALYLAKGNGKNQTIIADGD